MLFGSNSNDIDKRIATLVDSVTDLTVTVKTMATKHEALSQDQDILFKKVDKNENEIRSLQTMSAKIDTVSNLAKYGGLALIGAIIASWNSLSTKVDIVTAKTENNTQNITYLQKDNLDDQKQLDAMAAKIADNREAILTKLKTKKDRD